MPFHKYPHLEKWGNVEVSDIGVGRCHIMPKLDGTNASMWIDDGVVCYGSRNRQLSLDHDNQGFMNTMSLDGRYAGYLIYHPNHVLYGEWLVPHSLKNYRDDAWRKFYVFDVYDTVANRFLEYNEYESQLKAHGLDYIPVYKIINNPSVDQLLIEAKNIKYLLADDTGVGEGIVVKNYDYVNRYGRTVWAKIVTSEIKESHVKEMGAPEIGGLLNEQKIADHAVTLALVDKEIAKLGDWHSRLIPRLLETAFYCVVTEELWTALKTINYGSVNFRALRAFVIARVKQLKPELF